MRSSIDVISAVTGERMDTHSISPERGMTVLHSGFSTQETWSKCHNSEEANAMTSGCKAHIFIGHAWKNHIDYENLIEMFDAMPEFEYHNCSVLECESSLEVDELKQRLFEQIRCAKVVILLAGMYVTYGHSDWLQFEAKTARSLGIPIVVVTPWGSVGIARFLDDNADEVVAYPQRGDASGIVEAIHRVRKSDKHHD
jgi:hypothetical protein